MEQAVLGFARWMARRNGSALSRAVFSQLRRCAQKNPTQPAIEHWRELLEQRKGWHRVRQYVYEFHTGERMELRPRSNEKELLHLLATAELKTLTAGMHPSLQQELLNHSVSAALDAWKGAPA